MITPSSSDCEDQRTIISESDDFAGSSTISYEREYEAKQRTWERGPSGRDGDGDDPLPPASPAKFVVCESCSRTFRENLIEKHMEEFHPQVKCSLCKQMVDRYRLRRHQEKECPKRLRMCPHCYLQVKDAEFERHICSCPPPLQYVERKERFAGTKGLSFKGTIFDEHTKIAESFINIARGHPEKPPYNMLVKAESKNKMTLIPALKDLADALSPASYYSFPQDNLLDKNGRDAYLLSQVAIPLQKAFAREQRRKERAREKLRKRKARRSRKAAAKDPDLQQKPVIKAPQPPPRAVRVREVHSSLSHRFRDDCYRRRFVRSWLGKFFLDKEELKELDIKAEEAIEDAIIDEAIELEMKKDVLRRIPRDRWPAFVEEMKRRRSKWKDLGFSLEDCPVPSGGDKNDSSERNHGIDNDKPLELGKVEIVEEESVETIPYWKLVENNIERRGKGAEDASLGGFYKPCDSCYQLFHEDHLLDHLAACKEQKERMCKKRQRIKEVWKPKKTTSSRSCSYPSPFTVPRPFARQEHCSSLALSVAPHTKHYRWGKSKYAFITPAGRL